MGEGRDRKGIIYQGDSFDVLHEKFEDESVDCVITSPPYWRLRDYKVENQLGKEESSIRYIHRLLHVFNEVKRVLKKTGNCFVVLGDTYVDKSLELIPSRFAFAMKNEGWILRDYVVWDKPNPLPSPAKDRFILNWEHVFHFTKSQKYFFELQYNERPDGYLGSIMKSVWRIPVKGIPDKHYAVYPLKLIEPMIKAGCPKYICSKCGFMRKYIYVLGKINTRSGKNYGQLKGKTGDDLDPNQRTHQRDFSKYRQTPIRIHKKLFPIGGIKHAERSAGQAGTYSGNEWLPNVKWMKECGADSNLGYNGIALKDYEEHGAQNASNVKRNILNSILNRKSYEMTKCNCTDNDWYRGVILDPFIGSGTTALGAIKYDVNYIGIELDPKSIDIAHKRIVEFDISEKRRKIHGISKQFSIKKIRARKGILRPLNTSSKKLEEFGFTEPI